MSDPKNLDLPGTILALDETIRKKERELEALKASRNRHAEMLIDSWAFYAKLSEKRRSGTVYLARDQVFSCKKSSTEKLGQALKINGRDDLVEVQWGVNFDKLKSWLRSLIKEDEAGDLDVSEIPEEIRKAISIHDRFSVRTRKS